MNIPCASGNCRMAACFALTRTGRWQRACKGLKGKKRRSMLKSGYLPTLIVLLSIRVHDFCFSFGGTSYDFHSDFLVLVKTLHIFKLIPPANMTYATHARKSEDEAPVLRLLGRISYYRKPQVSFIKYPGSMA